LLLHNLEKKIFFFGGGGGGDEGGSIAQLASLATLATLSDSHVKMSKFSSIFGENQAFSGRKKARLQKKKNKSFYFETQGPSSKERSPWHFLKVPNGINLALSSHDITIRNLKKPNLLILRIYFHIFISCLISEIKRSDDLLTMYGLCRYYVSSCHLSEPL